MTQFKRPFIIAYKHLETSTIKTIKETVSISVTSWLVAALVAYATGGGAMPHGHIWFNSAMSVVDEPRLTI